MRSFSTLHLHGAETGRSRSRQSQRRVRHVRAIFWTAALLAGFSLMVAGCGDDDKTPITSISDAIGGEGDAELEGFVVIGDGVARLCDVLRESFPPQCGDPAIEIENVEAVDVELTTAEGVSWTDLRVTLTGTVDSGVLTVDR